MVLTKEQKDNDLVKSLLNSNFSEEVVASWINSGSINLVKSIEDIAPKGKEGDEDDKEKSCGADKKVMNKSADTKKVEDEEDNDGSEDEGDAEGAVKKKSCSAPKTENMGKETDTSMPNVMKSITEDIMGKVTESNADIMKSIPNLINEAMAPITEKFEKSLDGMRRAIEAFGTAAPSFKGAGLTQSVIEKSIGDNGFQKDDKGKMSLSISKDRTLVRELIQKSIEEEGDSAIKKSLMDNTLNYVLDPIAGAIGEPAAIYLYGKKGIKLTE